MSEEMKKFKTPFSHIWVTTVDLEEKSKECEKLMVDCTLMWYLLNKEAYVGRDEEI